MSLSKRHPILDKTSFQKAIKENFVFSDSSPIRFILLSSTHYHFVDSIINTLIKLQMKCIPDSEQVQLNGEEVEETTLYSEISTQSMFHVHRLIIIRNSDQIIQNIIKNKKSNFYFSEYISHIKNTTICLFHFHKDKLLSNVLSFFTPKHSICFEQIRPKNYQMAPLLIQTVKQNGFNTTIQAMELLLERISYKIDVAQSILKNLYIYCINSKNITIEDVKEVSFNIEGDLFFQIIQEVTLRKITKAIHTFTQHNLKGSSEKIFNLLSKLFSSATSYFYLQQGQIPVSEITKFLDITPYQLKNINYILSNYQIEEIETILHSFETLDQQLKENSSLESKRIVLSKNILSLKK